MFVEYHRKFWQLADIRIRFFRWWRHELTSAQVALDICLFVTLFPSMMVTVFNVDFLDLEDHPTAADIYGIAGLTAIVVATLWRADATSRAKARERDALLPEVSEDLDASGGSAT